MSQSPSSSSSAATTTPNRTDAAAPHFFPTAALDHAFSGITAGAVATVCMNPLDLIKVKFQVDTSTPAKRGAPPSSWRPPLSLGPSVGGGGATSASGAAAGAGAKVAAADVGRPRGIGYYLTGGKVGRDLSGALRDIVRTDGWRGLYRGLSPNVAGNSASWGLYFLWYTMIKEYMARGNAAAAAASDGAPGSSGGGGASGSEKLSPGQHLLAASESGAVTALMTNPIWVVKTRMFATSRSGKPLVAPPAPPAGAAAAAAQSVVVYRGLAHGISHIWRTEGVRGLYRGAGLALFGVSNGAIQFVAYEELKRWRTQVALRRRREQQQQSTTTSSSAADAAAPGADGSVQLSNAEYIVMSGASKLVAIVLTYPYQVIRSRIQNHATSHLYPDVASCVRLTWRHEGWRGLYKGMAANAVRILPGTCVTFVVYENTSWALRRAAKRREERRGRRGVEEGSGALTSA